jgi:hypothetical protein
MATRGTPQQSRRPAPRDQRFLEALCLMRALYARRGAQDTLVVISVGEVIAAAEMQLRVQRSRDQRILRRFVSG